MTSDHRCPRDDERLERQTVGPAAIHSCSRCGGLWISRADLESFLRMPSESWKLGALPSGGSTLLVPDSAHCLCEDRPLMSTATQDDVRIDLCPSCGGVWLDGGELQELLRRAEAEEKDPRNDVAQTLIFTVIQLIGGLFGGVLQR